MTKLVVINRSRREENIFTGKSITSIAVDSVKWEFDATDECDQHTAGLMWERCTKGLVLTGDTGVSQRWENPIANGRIVGYLGMMGSWVYKLKDAGYYDGEGTRLSPRAIPHITFSNS